MRDFTIKDRTGEALFTCELPDEVEGKSYAVRMGFAVQKAVVAGANLTAADLMGADLADANLTGAYLADANLTGADFTDADLTRADLKRANLTDADLTRANFTGAYLADANLTGANLASADLMSFRQDFIAETLRLPNELEDLRDAIVGGRINGRTYSGRCACLAGTLAKARGLDDYDGEDIAAGSVVFHAQESSPREQWFTMILPGQTPENNQAARLALEWLDEAIAIRDAIRATSPITEGNSHA